MFTIVIEFLGAMGRKTIFGLNKVQAEHVYNNWVKNPDVKYVGVIEEF